jgi:crossover junction endodeoxyribonuclease RusA
VIELPWPAKILWPNGRGHHMKKHREFQKHKEWARIGTLASLPISEREAKAVMAQHIGRNLRLVATFHPKTRNAIDKDNASSALKAYQDGIALALGVNDNLFDEPAILFGEPVKGGRVVVSIVAP